MSSTLTINNVCYKVSGSDALQVSGDVAMMGMSMMGIVVSCICVLLFAFLMTTSQSFVIKVILVCCASSLANSIYKYFTVKGDLDTLKSRMAPC
jgi:hypothetical protein